MRFVWVETEKIDKNGLSGTMGQVMVELDSETARYITAVRDDGDSWHYGVSNLSLLEAEEAQLEYLEKYENLGDARSSEYGIYFVMAYLTVVAETIGLDEHDDKIIDLMCDMLQNAPDEKMIKLLKHAAKGSHIALMRAAIKLDDMVYVQKYIGEFKNDEKGPSRFMEFEPSSNIEQLLVENGGINQVTDWDIKEVRDKIREFNKERDWDKFHTPENLAKSIAIEAGELLECFQWDNKFDRQSLSEELADVMMYCIMMADAVNIDIKQEMLRKMALNGAKYPINKAKGKSIKYNKL